MSSHPSSTRSTSASAEGRERRDQRRFVAGLYGASGTTGVELARLLARHPQAELAFATSRAGRGKHLDDFDPAAPSLALEHPDDVEPGATDVVFLCLPHGTSGPLAERCVAAGARVIDVSGDHRLRDADTHTEIYASERSHELAADALYGLPELGRERHADAQLIANPGCYATASILALAPLAAAGQLDDLAIIDAKSGVSGAGRTPSATNHFCSVSGDVQPYKLGRVHRHTAEIEQELAVHDAERRPHPVVFNPHLVPIERGILATVVVRGCGTEDVSRTLRGAYRDEPFVRVLDDGRTPRIRAVAGTNRADIGVSGVAGTDATVITVAIDNLLKGAAGQAVQNFNLALGLPETTGLEA